MNQLAELYTERPGLFLWGIVFGYAVLAAIFVQLILLPYLLPSWHAGDGLMISSRDSLMFHQVALDLATKIKTQGWNSWVLRPAGQSPAGIAAIFYALVYPAPWVLIPLNAAVHATASLVLFIAIRDMSGSPRAAFWAAIPFAFYPSAMFWYTQLHKDGISILGVFFIWLGWIRTCRLESWERRLQPVLVAATCLIVGNLLLRIDRQYLLQVMQGALLPLCLTQSLLLLWWVAVRRISPWRGVGAFFLVWIIVLACNPPRVGWLKVSGIRQFEAALPSLPKNDIESRGLTASSSQRRPIVRFQGEYKVVQPEADLWSKPTWLPTTVRNKFYTIAVVRNGFSADTVHYKGRSNIDAERQFSSVKNVVAYLPRALQIALFAPFPQHWGGEGSYQANSIMRRISALEMTGIYLALACVPVALWHWRLRTEAWGLLCLSLGFLSFHGLVITNIGTLYRMRYGYIMTLVAIGVAWLVAMLESRRNRIAKPRKGSF